MLSVYRVSILLLTCTVSCIAQDSAAIQLKVVKGAPFSAQAITESRQTLADGNHIVRKNTAVIARDSEGRTRREQILPHGESIVFVHDPVLGAQ